MLNKFDTNMSLLRNSILKDIYDGVEVTEAELNFTDLSIYSRNETMFSRLSKVIKKSEIDDKIVLTNEQIECLNILENNNLFLSAPTSFGKTYIALEYIARNINKLNNIIFVVPTISLMNELRIKCFKLFNDEFIIITSDAELEQYQKEIKKIMIVVPERISTKKFKSYINRNNIDFLVYDEIYKLKFEKKPRDSNSRIIKMNYIYKYLLEKSKKTLLLGPFIKNVDFNISNIEIVKYITNLNLVFNTIELETGNAIDKIKITNDKKFVYFKSPTSIRSFLKENDLIPELKDVNKFEEDIIKWIDDNIHPDWYYSIYLKKGIGIHHGKTPIFLRKYIEHEYSKKDGYIHTILCTSTLMEGINTPTNRLIIHDPPHGTFEMNNLIGRVGRLNPDYPSKGTIHIYDDKTLDLYNPDQWIDLKILYETEDVLTDTPEDEILYLEKKSKDGKPEEKLNRLKDILSSKFNINISEVIDSEIEIELLINFVENFDEITRYEKEWNVIHDIKFKLLGKGNSYLSGLLTKNYSFTLEKDYIFDAVYTLMINNGILKPVINYFISLYETNVSDINTFIDVLFQIDEFIKFKMMKMVSIYELFNRKGLFDKTLNRAFIQSIHMIESYCDSVDGYERILGDLGIPQEDIIKISNIISGFTSAIGTEKKLKKVIDEPLFQELSPFSKKIINRL